VAADAGFCLYLSGHTHGGQVCPPGGRSLVTHFRRHRGSAAGRWTHSGIGATRAPASASPGFPCGSTAAGEVTLITLLRSAPDPRNWSHRRIRHGSERTPRIPACFRSRGLGRRSGRVARAQEAATISATGAAHSVASRETARAEPA
jgi:hypothetical protein